MEDTVSGTLRAEGENRPSRPSGVCFVQNSRDEVRFVGGDGDIAGCISAEGGMKQQNYIAKETYIRRLTPVECERLQGFPDNYTKVPYNGKTADSCSDGPRYKALGNSWAVPCAAWVGKRIDGCLKEA